MGTRQGLSAKRGKRSMPTNGGAKPLIVVDTREQAPYKFRADRSCAGSVVKKLDYGDYQIDGHPELVVVERKKSIDELCGNIGKHRERFERELQRMQSCRWRFVVIEDSWFSIQDPDFSRMNYHAILATIVAFELRYGVNFVFANTRKWARRITKQILLKAYAEWRKEQSK